MITLAERIREAREAHGAGGAMRMAAFGVAFAAENEEPDRSDIATDPAEIVAGLPPEIAARIVTRGGPVYVHNPSARCDYCPRTTNADKLVEVQPGRYACDVCIWKAERGLIQLS